MTSVEDSPFTDAVPGLVGMYADFFGLAIVAPILPEWVKGQHRSAQWVGYIVSGQYSAVVLGSFLFGGIADKYGNVCALTTCMLIDAGLFAASGWAPSAESLLAMRVLVGVATPQALAVSWIATVTPSHMLPKRMGLIAAYIHIGIVSGTIAGGFLDWRTACVVSAVPPVVTVALLARFRPRSRSSDEDVVNKDADDGALWSGIKTWQFASVATCMLANGFELSIQFALFVVVLTEGYGLSRQQYALSLVPASFIQIFNHYFLLPKLIVWVPNPYDLLARLSLTLTFIFVVVIFANLAFPQSPWPLLIVQCLAFWTMSFSQGAGNFASATHAARVAPGSKAALVGLGRSSLNLGLAIAPSLLIAIYLNVNLRAALAVLAFLYLIATLVSYRAAKVDRLRAAELKDDETVTSDGTIGEIEVGTCSRVEENGHRKDDANVANSESKARC